MSKIRPEAAEGRVNSVPMMIMACTKDGILAVW